MNYHEFCVIRGCTVNGGNIDPESASNKTIYGVMVRGARGTIIENNRFENCLIGGPVQKGDVAGEIIDLIVRDNYYYNCEDGIKFSVNTASTTPMNLERMIIENNMFDLPAPSGTPGTYVPGYGIKFLVSNAKPTVVYKAVIVRNNRVRGKNGWPVWAGSIGLQFSNVQNLTVENNIVDVTATEPDYFVQQWSCGTVQAFNNRRSTGELIEVLDPTKGVHVPELTTEAELVVLGF